MGKRVVVDGRVQVVDKNSNGHGSVYQLPNGNWAASIPLPNGRRKKSEVKTRKEAYEKRDEVLAAIKKGLPVVNARETVEAFLERWLRDIAANRVRRTTLTRYTLDARRHIIPELGQRRLQELTPQALQAFINGLSAKGLGARSVAHVRSVLRAALTQAEREGLIGRNAAKLVTLPRETKKPVKALTPDEATALLDAFAGHDLEALITVALATGCRRGELLGMQWSDLDLDTGSLRVERQLQRINGVYEPVELQTEKSRRSLSLPPIAVEALHVQRQRQEEWRLIQGPAWKETGLVFTTETGTELNGSSVTHRYQGQLKRAGLSKWSFHYLRHGAASLLLAQGADMRRIMEQLGHSQIGLTMKTYAHIVPALLKDNANLLEQALRRPPVTPQ